MIEVTAYGMNPFSGKVAKGPAKKFSGQGAKEVVMAMLECPYAHGKSLQELMEGALRRVGLNRPERLTPSAFLDLLEEVGLVDVVTIGK